MPLILDSSNALPLDKILATLNSEGLDWQIKKSGNEPLPYIRGLGTLACAGAEEISFLANRLYQGQLIKTRAAAVLIEPETAQYLSEQDITPSFVQIICKKPYLLYACLSQWFNAVKKSFSSSKEVHQSALISPHAFLGQGVEIGPYCIVEDGAYVGCGSVLGPNCILGRHSRLGTNCLVHARTTLYEGVSVGNRAIIHSGAVLGADGFGFAFDSYSGNGSWKKIPQFGSVLVGDDVEIGANTTVDRGSLEDTQIGNGVKLDNHIMVAHNVRIGDHTVIAACVGIAGSTSIGKRCIIGGAAMLSGHLVLGDDIHISGGTAITSDVLKPGRYTGVYPHFQHKQWQRNTAIVRQLTQLRSRVRNLERKY